MFMCLVYFLFGRFLEMHGKSCRCCIVFRWCFRFLVI